MLIYRRIIQIIHPNLCTHQRFIILPQLRRDNAAKYPSYNLSHAQFFASILSFFHTKFQPIKLCIVTYFKSFKKNFTLLRVLNYFQRFIFKDPPTSSYSLAEANKNISMSRGKTKHFDI